MLSTRVIHNFKKVGVINHLMSYFYFTKKIAMWITFFSYSKNVDNLFEKMWITRVRIHKNVDNFSPPKSKIARQLRDFSKIMFLKKIHLSLLL